MRKKRVCAKSFLVRFFEKIHVPSDSPTACLEWTGAISSSGYGSIAGDEQKNISAHCAAWIIANGTIPEGLCVLHRCDNRRCVRPAHLFLGTRVDNNRDMAAKDRAHKSKSGLPRGVWPKGNKWQAVRGIRGRRYCLGTFSTVAEASAAVRDFEPKEGGR
jgi:hypothetical protein